MTHYFTIFILFIIICLQPYTYANSCPDLNLTMRNASGGVDFLCLHTVTASDLTTGAAQTQGVSMTIDNATYNNVAEIGLHSPQDLLTEIGSIQIDLDSVYSVGTNIYFPINSVSLPRSASNETGYTAKSSVTASPNISLYDFTKYENGNQTYNIKLRFKISDNTGSDFLPINFDITTYNNNIPALTMSGSYTFDLSTLVASGTGTVNGSNNSYDVRFCLETTSVSIKTPSSATWDIVSSACDV